MRRTKANSNKAVLLFALSDKKKKKPQKAESLMKANYAEDIWVPSVGNEKWARAVASYLISEKKAFLRLVSHLFGCIQRRRKTEEASSSSVADSLRHAREKGQVFCFFFTLKG